MGNLARLGKSELPAFEKYMRGLRNLGQGPARHHYKPRKH